MEFTAIADDSGFSNIQYYHTTKLLIVLSHIVPWLRRGICLEEFSAWAVWLELRRKILIHADTTKYS
jgi:hypothetical protein